MLLKKNKILLIIQNSLLKISIGEEKVVRNFFKALKDAFDEWLKNINLLFYFSENY